MIGKMGARNVDNFAMGVTLMHLLQAMLQAVIGSNTVEASFILFRIGLGRCSKWSNVSDFGLIVNY
jgi:hypothetical protein